MRSKRKRDAAASAGSGTESQAVPAATEGGWSTTASPDVTVEASTAAVEPTSATTEGPAADSEVPAAPALVAPARPKRRKDRSVDGQIRTTRLLGLLCCLVGFVAIGLGWHGMASVACPDCQLPYLLSGGATGLGLIMFGVMLLIVAQLRSDRLADDRQFERLLRALGVTEPEELVVVEVVVDELPGGSMETPTDAVVPDQAAADEPYSADEPTQVVEPPAGS